MSGDARTTKLDDLELERHRVFGSWFDFGDDWYHQLQVERVEQAIPTVTYPRVVKRVGKSPPQDCEESSPNTRENWKDSNADRVEGLQRNRSRSEKVPPRR